MLAGFLGTPLVRLIRRHDDVWPLKAAAAVAGHVGGSSSCTAPSGVPSCSSGRGKHDSKGDLVYCLSAQGLLDWLARLVVVPQQSVLLVPGRNNKLGVFTSSAGSCSWFSHEPH